MYLEELKERIKIGAYAYRGDTYSFGGNIIKTPEVLRNIKNQELKNVIIRLAELVLNTMEDVSTRPWIVPLMKGIKLDGTNLFSQISNGGIGYDARLHLLYRLISTGDEYRRDDVLLLDFCTILHFNVSETELRSYMESKWIPNTFDGVEIGPLDPDTTIEDYMLTLFKTTELDDNLFTA